MPVINHCDLRLYEPCEAGCDGYPLAWHETLKHLVREEAGNRCVRCFHPYKNGKHGRGEWTPCDELCKHHGPIRFRQDGWGDWQLSDQTFLITSCAMSRRWSRGFFDNHQAAELPPNQICFSPVFHGVNSSKFMAWWG